VATEADALGAAKADALVAIEVDRRRAPRNERMEKTFIALFHLIRTRELMAG
jgi:hypothetical protein